MQEPPVSTDVERSKNQDNGVIVRGMADTELTDHYVLRVLNGRTSYGAYRMFVWSARGRIPNMSPAFQYVSPHP